MYTDRHYQSRLNWRKLSIDTITTINSRDLRSLPLQRDPHPSLSSDCPGPGPGPGPVDMMVIGRNGEDEFHRGKRRYSNNTRKLCVSTSSRPRVLLCPYYFAIIFLLAAGLPSMSIVRAQPSLESTVVTESTTALLPTNAPAATTTTTTTVPTIIPEAEPVTVTAAEFPPTPSSMDGSLLTNSTAPTTSPTESPSRTMTPSSMPSDVPSSIPTVSLAPTRQPSLAPTSQPSWSEASAKETKFRQEFLVGNEREFNAQEIIFFEALYVSYTNEFTTPINVLSI